MTRADWLMIAAGVVALIVGSVWRWLSSEVKSESLNDDYPFG